MQIVNGTSYHDDTPRQVIDILESARMSKERIRIWYGSDGKCWNEEFDTIGTIGRSYGTSKIPLLIKNSRSLGGGAILDNRIVRIDKNKSTIYKDNSIHFDTFVSTDIGTVYNETRGEIYAKCKNADSGKRLADFMNGKRWNK